MFDPNVVSVALLFCACFGCFLSPCRAIFGPAVVVVKRRFLPFIKSNNMFCMKCKQIVRTEVFCCVVLRGPIAIGICVFYFSNRFTCNWIDMYLSDSMESAIVALEKWQSTPAHSELNSELRPLNKCWFVFWIWFLFFLVLFVCALALHFVFVLIGRWNNKSTKRSGFVLSWLIFFSVVFLQFSFTVWLVCRIYPLLFSPHWFQRCSTRNGKTNGLQRKYFTFICVKCKAHQLCTVTRFICFGLFLVQSFNYTLIKWLEHCQRMNQ